MACKVSFNPFTCSGELSLNTKFEEKETATVVNKHLFSVETTKPLIPEGYFNKPQSRVTVVGAPRLPYSSEAVKSEEKVNLLDEFTAEEIEFASELAHLSYRNKGIDSTRTFTEIVRNGIGGTNTGIDLSGVPESMTDTGFCYRLFFDANKGRYYLSFRGTDNISGLTQSFKQGIGISSSTYLRTFLLVSTLTEKVGARNVVCIGHSLGGGLAIASSKLTGCRSISFNPPFVKDKTVTDYSKECVHNVDDLVLVFYDESDPLTMLNKFCGGKLDGQRHSLGSKGFSLFAHKINSIKEKTKDYLKNFRAVKTEPETVEKKPPVRWLDWFKR